MQGSTGDTFNEVLNFAPRAVVFLLIMIIYGRIHWFLRRRGQLSAVGTIPKAPVVDSEDAATSSQPWEDLHLSGLSQIAMMDDPKASQPSCSQRQSSISPISQSDMDAAAFPTSKAIDQKELKDVDSRSDNESHVVSVSDSVSDGTSLTRNPSSIDRPLSTRRDPYATGRGHTPYRGPLPIAKRRAREEHYETLHGLLTRKAAMLFLLFPLTVYLSSQVVNICC